MGFKIVRNDIVKMNTEAIVNTANQYVEVGPGCDSAIYRAAGYDELLKYRRDNIGEVSEGEVFITPGFNLQNKYIIHAVSPVYINGEEGENEKLHSCYRKSLQLAKEYGIKSIAFPLISTGSFGYPKEEGMRIAVDEIYDFLFDNEMDIYLVVFDTQAVLLGEKIQPDLKAYIDYNYVCEKREEEFGDRYFGSLRPTDDRYDEYVSERRRLEERLAKRDKRESMPRPVGRMEAPSFLNTAPKKSAPIFEEDECCEASIDLADVDNVEMLEEKLAERVKHMSDTYAEYLQYLIKRNGLTNSEAYNKALVTKQRFAKIKNGGHPSKIIALQLCIGAQLSMDDTKDLLARAGYALSPCDLTDIIFSFFIENKIYDMIELDIQLGEYGLPSIIE